MNIKDRELLQSYTQASASYDHSRFVDVVEDEMVALLLKRLDIRAGMKVLDVAAGTGRTAIPLANAGAVVTAVDLTPGMFEKMNAKARSLGIKTLQIRQANARYLPFAENTFDAVLSFRFFHLFDRSDQACLLEEMHRVAKPGAKVLVEYNNSGSLWVGGALHDLRRALGKQKALSRVSSGDLRDLYKPYHTLEQQGFSWPFIGTAAGLAPQLAKAALKLSTVGSFRNITRYVWVISAKPH